MSARPAVENPPSNDSTPKVEHSQPIPIATGGHIRRSGSSFDDSPPSSTSSDSSLNSPSSPITPSLPTANQPKLVPLSPSTSPLLSYFLSTSPKSGSTTFPFRRSFNPVVEDEDTPISPVVSRHTRSASIAGTWPAGDRFVSPPQQSIQATNQVGSNVVNQEGRAAGLLRRLSLGAALKPQPSQPPSSSVNPHHTRGSSPPPNSPSVDRSTSISPTTSANGNGNRTPPVARKTRRANTIAPGTQRPSRPRAPSPMGERILKGHFDGFN